MSTITNTSARRFPRPHPVRRLRQHRPGRVAADPAPHRHRAGAHHDRHRGGQGQRRGRRSTASSSSRSALTRENFRRVLDPLIGRGDFLLNVSVEVSSVALIKLCWEKGAMYLDTCIEPWPGGYTDPDRAARRAHQLRAARRGAGAARRQRSVPRPRCSRTAPIPAWCRTSSSRRCSTSPPTSASTPASRPSRADWGELARKLGVKVIHIAERDTQVVQQAQGAERVRQHLVGRRLRQRGLAAGRDSAGARTSATSRATASATISAAWRRST